eukprot:TRINITY_DN10356_c0_g1_i7.p3 TRINITY_DN10356_c0_g1~~TRINITY_DN10356_c0_g1_i7.p3  ORF type:complete len:116 (+),score=19.08 TRINITY_DN10356_c0_g1_i7:46-393(+)
MARQSYLLILYDREDYLLAGKLKTAIEHMQSFGRRLGSLQQAKADAVHAEAFERAARIKTEIDQLRLEMEASISKASGHTFQASNLKKISIDVQCGYNSFLESSTAAKYSKKYHH